jgi:hypothetical protein
MRTLINLILLCSVLLALTACGGGKGIRHCVDADPADDKPPTCVTVTGDAKADAFYARQGAADESRAAQIAALADTQHCKDDRCVENAKAFAALAFVAGGNAQPQQYVPQPSTAARVGLALIGQLSPLASAAVAWRSSDNSVRSAEAQFGFLGGVVRDVSTASARSNEAAFGVLPQLAPSIGGDQIAGGQHIGHNAGRDLGADGGSVDNSETTTTTTQVRDINTGTQNSGLMGSGRLDSPNTRTNTDTNNVGPRCTGQDCQRVPLPEPEDEG